MKLDIVIVTYNSEKWMKNCITSIEKSKGIDLNDINLYVIDNVSKDGTIKLLESLKENTKLGSFNILNSGENLGFGKANNKAFEEGKSDYVLFLNPDTEMEEDTLSNLFEAIQNASDEFGAFELRQKPYEHPKIYDPITGETSWCSGACIVVKREVFKKVGGFDKNIFMYAEDVDLSWNIRMHGYKLMYVPKSAIKHYSYSEANQVKPTQYYYSLINNLNLRLKYGNYRKFFRWMNEYIKILRRPDIFEGSKKGLKKVFRENLKNIKYYSTWKHQKENKKLIKNFKPDFLMFDYEVNRLGAFIENVDVDENPKVSVIVRTCGRPNVLRETLISLRNQTYKNIEIVIVEDGENKSEKMINEEFSDLNIVYQATNAKVGRCVGGNTALKLATGDYFNFLDDDDLFYADHVETLVKELIRNKEYKVAYALSYESKIEVISREPKYVYKEYSKQLAHNKEFSRLTLLTRNAFPIQCVMFSRELYEKYGGFDLELDNLEDWELWARYSLENPFLFVQKVTSIYRVPYKTEEYGKRQEEIDYYYKAAQEKILSRNIVANAGDILEELKHI